MAKWDAYSGIIEEKAKFHGVNANLIRAIITVESNWKPTAQGDSGKAIGLMQIWLTTAQWISGIQVLTKQMLFKPAININLGTKYLARQIKKYGTEGGVAAYNAGSARRNKKGDFINRGYVNKVNKAYKAITGKYLYKYRPENTPWPYYVAVLGVGWVMFKGKG